MGVSNTWTKFMTFFSGMLAIMHGRKPTTLLCSTRRRLNGYDRRWPIRPKSAATRKAVGIGGAIVETITMAETASRCVPSGLWLTACSQNEPGVGVTIRRQLFEWATDILTCPENG